MDRRRFISNVFIGGVAVVAGSLTLEGLAALTPVASPSALALVNRRRLMLYIQ
jgi:hypothetical protein